MVLREANIEFTNSVSVPNPRNTRVVVPEVEAKIFSIEALREFSTRVFLHFGVPKDDDVPST